MANAVQLTATPLDAAGTPLAGRAVSWVSDAPGVASVGPTGIVQAVSAGSATVRATCEGKSGGSVITVVNPVVPVASLLVTPPSAVLTLPIAAPPPVVVGSNEPAGLTLISDLAFPASFPVQKDGLVSGMPGWGLVNPNGNLLVEADPSLPDPAVADFVYPIGHPEGSAPATLYQQSFVADQLYARFRWKPSNPWQNEFAGVNKICFFVTTPGGTFLGFILMMTTDGAGGWYLRTSDEINAPSTNYEPNIAKTPVVMGQWHDLELWLNRTGGLRWWLDGILQGDYPAWTCPNPFTMFQFSPTWGGYRVPPDVKTEVDHFWFNHVRLSGR